MKLERILRRGWLVVLLLAALVWPASGKTNWPVTLMVQTNGALASQTNFFTVNTNYWLPLVAHTTIVTNILTNEASYLTKTNPAAIGTFTLNGTNILSLAGSGAGTNAILKTDLAIFNVLDYGAVGDGVTDDSGAIQTAVYACGTNGGGTVLFPSRDSTGKHLKYLINNVAGPTTNAWGVDLAYAQIHLPKQIMASNAPMVIRLMGDTPVQFGECYPIGSAYVPATNFSTILVTNRLAARDYSYDSIFGAFIPVTNSVDPIPDPVNVWPVNGVAVWVHDLNFITPPRSSICPIYGASMTGVWVKNCRLDARDPNLIGVADSGGGGGYAMREPNMGGTAITLTLANNWCYNVVENCIIIGYGTAIQTGENAILRNTKIEQCGKGVYYQSGYSLTVLEKLIFGAVTYPIYGLTTDNQPDNYSLPIYGTVHIQHDNYSDSTNTWMNTVADLYDPSNYVHGALSYNMTERGIPTNNWNQVGGTNVSVTSLLNNSVNKLVLNGAGITNWTQVGGTANALTNNTAVADALMVGHNAGLSAYVSEQTIMAGNNAGESHTNTTGVAIGAYAAAYAANDLGLTALGALAAYQSSASDSLIAIGFQSGMETTSVGDSIMLGKGAGRGATGATRSIFLGRYAGTNRANTLCIETSGNAYDDGTRPLIYGEFDNRRLRLGETNGQYVEIVGNTITANASGLTNLNATNLTGTIPSGAASGTSQTNVTLVASPSISATNITLSAGLTNSGATKLGSIVFSSSAAVSSIGSMLLSKAAICYNSDGQVDVVSGGNFGFVASATNPGGGAPDTNIKRASAGTFLFLTNGIFPGTLTVTNGVTGSWAQMIVTNRMTNSASVINEYNGPIAGTNWVGGASNVVMSSFGGAFAVSTNAITNLIAGAYHVDLTVSCLALADTPPTTDETHYAIFTNGTEMATCEVIFTPTDTIWLSGAAHQIVTLPANFSIDVRHKNVDDTDRVIIRKLCLTVTPAN